MSDNREISRYLTAVLDDWHVSKGSFPKNTYPCPDLQWPIPFFGNPKHARVATVGVNPSSEEFATSRNWQAVNTSKLWKERLRDYFKHPTVPPHPWFDAWSTSLSSLGVSYQNETATHLDVSYRSTIAMLRNRRTDHREFRRMLQRDVKWFFKLILACPDLRVILTFGPIVRADGSTENLPEFLKLESLRNDYKMVTAGSGWRLRHIYSHKSVFVHHADAPNATAISDRVMKSVLIHRHKLLEQISSDSN